MIDRTLIHSVEEALASLQTFRSQVKRRGVDLGHNEQKINGITDALANMIEDWHYGDDTFAILQNTNIGGLIEKVVLARFYLQRFLQILKQRSLLRRLGANERNKIESMIDALQAQTKRMSAIEEDADSIFQHMTFRPIDVEPHGARHYDKAQSNTREVILGLSAVWQEIDNHLHDRSIDPEFVNLFVHVHTKLLEILRSVSDCGYAITEMEMQEGGPVESILEEFRDQT